MLRIMHITHMQASIAMNVSLSHFLCLLTLLFRHVFLFVSAFLCLFDLACCLSEVALHTFMARGAMSI